MPAHISGINAHAPTLPTVAGKELVLFPRQDVYVEKQRPTWSYRTSILQVGKTDAPDAEYRSFLAFDLSTVAGAHARVVSTVDSDLELTQRMATGESPTGLMRLLTWAPGAPVGLAI